jgi:hypothetical protein
MVNSGNNDNDRLQIVFSEVDSFLSDEPAEGVKDFIRFIFAEEERRRREEAQKLKCRIERVIGVLRR